MLGLFGIFGRSQEVQRLDRALRTAGLHPRLMPDAVKIATLKQLKLARDGTDADEAACRAAATLLSYCMLGPQEFADANGDGTRAFVESRIEAAIEVGESLDARLVLLALHAGVAHPEVIERHQLAAD